MDYLQYYKDKSNGNINTSISFKPCYKWITFNTKKELQDLLGHPVGFKPCYKWITFNTSQKELLEKKKLQEVLNLVINGLPSIPTQQQHTTCLRICFKPCYKWITFNTLTEGIDAVFMVERSHFYMVAKIIHFSIF